MSKLSLVCCGLKGQSGSIFMKKKKGGKGCLKNYNTQGVCRTLQIAESTLRKYALLFEREGYSFLKNAKGQRIYNEDHLAMLKRFLGAKNRNKKVENKILIAKLLDERYQKNNEKKDNLDNEVEFPFPYFNKMEDSLKSNLREHFYLLQEIQQLTAVLEKKINKITQEQEEHKELLLEILSGKEKGFLEKWRRK